MTLRCSLQEVAIYIPPDGTSELSPDAALAQCRAFLGDLVGGEVGDVRVFDDRAAKLTFAPDPFWGTTSSGETPAWDELQALWKHSYRLFLVADESALGKLPNGNTETNLHAYNAQLVEARRVFSQTPNAEKIAALAASDIDAWAEILEPMIFRRVKGPGFSRSKVAAPPALVAALLGANKVGAWCRIAWDVVAEVMPDRHGEMRAQAVRNFETWLTDSVDAVAPDKAAAEKMILDDDEAEYRRRVDIATAALEEGQWEQAIDDAKYAQDIAEDMDVGTEARRLELAAMFGAGKFAEALEELEPLMVLLSIFGEPWRPTKPVRFIAGLPERESALRYVAFLLTRVEKMDNAELVDAFDRLQRALDPKQAQALADARARKTVAKKKPAKKKPAKKKPAKKKPAKKPTKKKPVKKRR